MDASTTLWLPPLALAGCVRAAMLRCTHGRALSPGERDNYFPATPLVSLFWWIDGEGEWLASPGFSLPPNDYRYHPLMLAGPFTLPTHTRNPGPLRVLKLLFLPDAFAALTGIDPGALVNKVVDARLCLPADWLAWAQSLHRLPNNTLRLAAIEAFLLPRWTARARLRRSGHAFGPRYADWAEALAVRAATSAAGRSLRQVERRVKAWAGLPMRELRAVSRAERAFMAVAAAQNPGGVDWAQIAAETDYADQSHLCRETRRLTGFSPEELRRHIEKDEAFWAYRLWQ